MSTVVKVTPFPFKLDNQRRLNKVKRQVPCVISQKWLQFPALTDSSKDHRYLQLDVMTKDSLGKDLKICELLVTRESLEALLVCESQ